MTKASLNAGQRLTVELIEALGFGVVERLMISGGVPILEPEPRIVQAVKLDSEPQWQRESSDADLTLKKEFENLFDGLARLRDGVVDIEVRHGLPTRLVMERRYKELL